MTPFTRADLHRWIAEDVGAGDLTSEAIVPIGTRCRALVRLKEPGVVCGLAVAGAVLCEIDRGMCWEPLHRDGERIEPSVVAIASGDARAILAGERLALNLLGRLSGIATLTRAFVDAVAGTGVSILDTRKTTPGLRRLEKAAVLCGGGLNHRAGLDDAILIKDNHLRFAANPAAAVASTRDAGVPVELECETLDQVRDALTVGVERILLDNMSPAELARAVALVDGRASLEASGGVTLDTVRAIAETGVNSISIGALTHSARSLDVSLEVER